MRYGRSQRARLRFAGRRDQIKIAYVSLVNDEGLYAGLVESLLTRGVDQRSIFALRGAKSMTSGYNALVRAAPRAPYLCLVHQDTRLLFDVERRIPAFFEEHPDAGVVGFVGSTELSPAGAWWHAGQHVGGLIEGTMPRWCSAVSDFHPVDVVDGYCMFIRRDVFDTLGGFDERFDHWHMYDSDLCMTAKRHGLQNYVIEGLTQHLSSGSTAPPWDVERRKFSQKWYGT